MYVISSQVCHMSPIKDPDIVTGRFDMTAENIHHLWCILEYSPSGRDQCSCIKTGGCQPLTFTLVLHPCKVKLIITHISIFKTAKTELKSYLFFFSFFLTIWLVDLILYDKINGEGHMEIGPVLKSDPKD